MKTIVGAKAEAGEPEVVRLADLVAYQDGSVVSRQLLKKDAGNATIFAFASGRGLFEHTAPFGALAQILDGEAIVKLAGKPHRLKAGDAIVMPANRAHALDAVTPFKMAPTMIRSSA